MATRKLKKNILDKEVIFKTIQQNREMLQKLGVKEIGLFGSFVRNDQKISSDIDFFVQFEKGKKNFRNFINLAYFLEELFGRRVEIVTEKALSPYIGPRIIEEVEYAII
jgi:predicted nucleotidyltransferase